MHTLELVSGERRTFSERVGFWRPKTVTRQGELFEEWTVDGEPLQDLVRRHSGSATRPDDVSALSEDGRWPTLAVATLQRLLGLIPGDFEDGRVAILVCSADADLECGALSAEIIIDTDVVQWRNMAWQVDDAPLDLAEDGFEPPMHLTFARAQYEGVVRHALERYVAVASKPAKTNPYEPP